MSDDLVRRLLAYERQRATTSRAVIADDTILREAADQIERLTRIVQVGDAKWDTAAALVRANNECEELQQRAEAAEAEVARLREALKYARKELLRELISPSIMEASQETLDEVLDSIDQALAVQPTGTCGR